MEIKEQLTQMFLMQKTLNQNILKEFGQDSMTEEKLELAIIDELGELTHELKGDWCWWKKTQKPVDRKRVLEELVDVYHFVMTYEMCYGYKNNESIEVILNFYEDDIDEYYVRLLLPLSHAIREILDNNCKLTDLLILSGLLGFTFDEIYQEYLNKNKINYERLKNGY